MAAAVLTAFGVWGAIPLPEHPRPDFERVEWVNLNGEWDFTFDKKGENFDRKIVVPFSWACAESGITNDTEKVGWYRRSVKVPEQWRGRRVFVVVGASDWETAVWIDGQLLDVHQGGYTPFEVELTPFVKYGAEHELKICAIDADPQREGGIKFQNGSNRLYGKQGYGDARGIWQTVYMEARGETYFETVHFTPDIDRGLVKAKLTLAGPAKAPLIAKVKFKPEDRADSFVAVHFPKSSMVREVEIPMPGAKLWDLDNPYLYEVKVTLEGENVWDEVGTYFGMRKISAGVMPNGGHPYVMLNNKPVYLKLCLDQAYCPTGFYTYPSDEFMKNDILISKKLGLNGNRIHIKTEVPRRLYWADRLGLLIMADVPNAWGDCTEAYFREHEYTFREMVKRDMNHPSIFSWVLFNETWGLFNTIKNQTGKNGEKRRAKEYLPASQRRVARCYQLAKELDPTRLVEDNSPCNNDHVVTDLNTWHGYHAGDRYAAVVKDICGRTKPGGKWNYIGGHSQNGEPMLNSECGAVWGYFGGGWGMVGDVDWSWDYHQMMDAFRRNPKCCGFLYTEHHDVINEWNGYVRYDRTPKHTGVEELCPGMTVADWHGDAYLAVGDKQYRVYEPGAEAEIPVWVSLTTEKFAGKKLRIEGGMRWWDALGRMREKAFGGSAAEFTAQSWHHADAAKPKVKMPGEEAAGTVWFRLMDGEKAVARNFTCFAVRRKEGAGRAEKRAEGLALRVAPKGYAEAKFSAKLWDVLDGLKVCGAGSGEISYDFALPQGFDMGKAAGAEFFAEVSAKRLNGRDKEQGMDKTVDLDCMLGGGSKDGSALKNSYPMTGAYPFKGAVTVAVNGVELGTTELADDPADHRGILSWGEQPLKRIQESGSYGYMVKVAVPKDVLAKAKGGKVRVTLRAAENRGLAVFGERFGRYPADPTLLIK